MNTNITFNYKVSYVLRFDVLCIVSMFTINKLSSITNHNNLDAS